MKAVMISIQPKWCELIASGKKTVEVRKTSPKLEVPFKCYIYCTQGKLKDLGVIGNTMYEKRMKVIGEFVCNNLETFEFGSEYYKTLVGSCLSGREVWEYGRGKTLYGWHISDLVIYDKPKELSEFYRECKKPECDDCQHLYVENTPMCYEVWCGLDGKIPITRPPQSWCYVEEMGCGE